MQTFFVDFLDEPKFNSSSFIKTISKTAVNLYRYSIISVTRNLMYQVLNFKFSEIRTHISREKNGNTTGKMKVKI